MLAAALLSIYVFAQSEPYANIHGNSHFMFQELNNAQIADLIAGGLNSIIYNTI